MHLNLKKLYNHCRAAARRAIALSRFVANGQSPPTDDPVEQDRQRRADADSGQLARDLEHAMRTGQLTLADRLADLALQLDVRNCRAGQRLAECIARLRLAQKRPHDALAVLQTVPRSHSSSRLLEIVCLLHIGDRIDALLMLRRWCSGAASPSDVPLAARLLLALESFAAGDREEASQLLRCNLGLIEDPQSLRALTAMLVASPDAGCEAAELPSLVERLRATCVTHADRTLCNAFLGALRLPGRTNNETADQPRSEHVSRLARELEACEESIEPLVAAQVIEPDLSTARLLHAALREAMPALRDRPAAMQSLATISVLVENLENQHNHWMGDQGGISAPETPSHAIGRIAPSESHETRGKAA